MCLPRSKPMFHSHSFGSIADVVQSTGADLSNTRTHTKKACDGIVPWLWPLPVTGIELHELNVNAVFQQLQLDMPKAFAGTITKITRRRHDLGRASRSIR